MDQARRSGASWSQVGNAVGVSKQAAQKRFAPGKLAAAGRIASTAADPAIGAPDLGAGVLLGHNYIGTEHVLLGVLEAGGSAAEAFAALGLTQETGARLISAEFEKLHSQHKTG